MEFLGKLGIDWKLLIAQIVNFGILLYLLTRFLYKPIIARIEKDEAELEKAKTAEEKMQKEKENLQKEISKMKKNTKTQGQETIEQAEKVAEDIKSNAEKEAQALKKQYLEQSKNQALVQEKSLSDKLQQKTEKEVKKALEKKLTAKLDKKAKQSLDDLFFKKLSQQLKDYKFSGLTSKAAEKTAKESIRIEYANDFSSDKEKELKKIIAQKIKIEEEQISISKHKKSDLIAGYNLELAGLVFENNFLNLINNA